MPEQTSSTYETVTFSPQSLVAYFLKGVLECSGLTVSAAASSVADLEECVRRNQPAAIVYDVSFPFSTNWQALQALRSQPALRNVPVVVTTSDARELFRVTGYSNAIEIIVKPENIVGLRQSLRHAIEAVAPVRAA
jgi:CheY-like chemotaxis protein